MTRRRLHEWLVVVALGPLLACSAHPTCDDEMVTESETSNGLFTYTPAGAASTLHGDIGPGTGLSVASATSVLVVEQGTEESLGSSAIVVSGTFFDASDTEQAFFLVVTGVASGIRATIGADSQACFSSLASCTSLSGTIATTAFATDCRGQDGCALTIAGTLDAAASWTDGMAFAVDVTLGHDDAWEDGGTCSTPGNTFP